MSLIRPQMVMGPILRVLLASLLYALMGPPLGYASESALKISPQILTVRALLNEPAILELEITSDRPLGALDIKASGIKIQRELRAPSPYRRVFAIEPDTSVAGRVEGQIAVIDDAGRTVSAVPLRGDVKNHISVSPSQVMLGALAFGDDADTVLQQQFRLSSTKEWKISDVNLSELSDATFELRDADKLTKIISLRFPERSLKKGLPFGAFIRKTIRITTDLPSQREVTVPIVGFLSVNGTGRNFESYVFDGSDRWQGPWSTPNIAAAVLCPALLASLGYGVYLSRRPQSHGIIRMCGALLYLLTLAGIPLLVKTYSRGGWLAFSIGVVILMLLMKGFRKGLIACALAFVLATLALPSGSKRIASTISVEEDGSIRNRLLVWRGALQMIADNPLSGVGEGRFGQEFAAYYQEPWHRASYTTAVNDFLTFAAERGLVATLAVVTGAIFIFASGAFCSFRRKEAWMAPIFAVSMSLALCCVFSSLQSVREIRILALCSALILALYCIRCYPRAKTQSAGEGVLVRSLACSGLFAATACGIVLAASYARSVKISSTQVISAADRPFRSLEFEPAHGPCRGTVIYLAEGNHPLPHTGRHVLRRIAQGQWRSIAVDLPDYDQDAALLVAQVASQARGPVVILAEKSRARVAVAAASKIASDISPQLAFVSPVYSSALPQCDMTIPASAQRSRVTTIDPREWIAYKTGSGDLKGGIRTILASAAALSAGSPERSALSSSLDSAVASPTNHSTAIVQDPL